MKKYELYLDLIRQIISKKPVITTEITKRLVDDFEITEFNARKVISKLIKEGKLFACENLLFDSGSRLIYKTSNKEMFYSALIEYKPYLYYLIKILDNYKILSFLDIYKLSACSFEKGNKKFNCEKVLQEIRVFRDIEINEQFVSLKSLELEERKKKIYSYNKRDEKSLRIIPAIIHSQINMNYIVNAHIRYRSKVMQYPQMNGYCFDIIGKSKSMSAKDEECFLFYEICLDKEIYYNYLEYFKKRIDNVVNSNKTKIKGLGILVYSKIDELNLKQAHSMGLITIDISSMFGTKINHILEAVSSLDNPMDHIEKSIKINDTLSAIEDIGQEENLGNIKGELFERIVCSIVDKIYDGTNTIKERQKIVRFKEEDDKPTSREYDYIVENNNMNETILVECKSSKNKIELGGYHKDTDSITKDSVKYFYQSLSKYKYIYKDKNPKFVFFAANGFEDTAIKYMDTKLSLKLKSSKMDFYYDLKKVENELLKLNPTIKIDCDTWERFFINKKI